MSFFKKLFGFFWDKSLMTFLIIGGVNTVLSMSLNFALKNFANWPLFYSSAVSFAVLAVPAFYFNRKYSFKSTAPLGQSIFRFAAVTAVCFLLSYALNNLVMPQLRAGLLSGMNEMLFTLINIVGIQAVFTILNYCGQRLWAFKAKDEA